MSKQAIGPAIVSEGVSIVRRPSKFDKRQYSSSEQDRLVKQALDVVFQHEYCDNNPKKQVESESTRVSLRVGDAELKIDGIISQPGELSTAFAASFGRPSESLISLFDRIRSPRGL